jgi:hypothetical protein
MQFPLLQVKKLHKIPQEAIFRPQKSARIVNFIDTQNADGSYSYGFEVGIFVVNGTDSQLYRHKEC